MYIYTRSLGALRAPTSSWWPYGPALGRLNSSFAPFERSGRVTHTDVSIMHVSMMHVSMMHVSVMSNTGPMQVVSSCGQIRNRFRTDPSGAILWRHLVVKFAVVVPCGC